MESSFPNKNSTSTFAINTQFGTSTCQKQTTNDSRPLNGVNKSRVLSPLPALKHAPNDPKNYYNRQLTRNESNWQKACESVKSHVIKLCHFPDPPTTA